MTAEITDLATRAEQVVAGVVNSATRANGAPLTIAATDGAYVTDLDGKRYLDYHAAFGAILLYALLSRGRPATTPVPGP